MSTRSEKIAEIASLLNIDPSWLDGVIYLESSYNPQARNSLSGARGLIQIMDSTAQYMFNMPADTLIAKYPDFDSQMSNVVYPYFKRSMPFPTKQSLWMAVFFPAARNVPPDTTFQALYAKYPSAGSYNTFVKQNPGILKVSDYVNMIERKITGKKVVTGAVTIMPVVILLVTFLILRKGI